MVRLHPPFGNVCMCISSLDHQKLDTAAAVCHQWMAATCGSMAVERCALRQSSVVGR